MDRFRGVDPERGSVAVMVALLLAGVLVVAATVVDLGMVRSRAIDIQSAADLAALAAGDRLANADPVGACSAAIGSLGVNLGVTTPAASTTCAAMGGTTCSTPTGTAQATASVTVGKYGLSFLYPVADATIADPWFGAGKQDGTACQRMRVSVHSTEAVLFGAMVGQTKYQVARSATVRARFRPSTRLPALWLLDPHGCTSLAVSGGSQLTVGSTSPVVPGLVAVDSDGSACTGSQRTVSSAGSGTRTEAVPLTGPDTGAIRLYALPRNATSCTGSACDVADVAGGRLSPQPIPTSTRATRLPVDWRFDCRPTYPAYHGVNLIGCPYGTPAYVSNLSAAIGSIGNPGGFQRWSTSYSCNPAGNVQVSGSWWVDCPGGLSIGNGTTVTFVNGNVVLDAGITMTGGALNFNTANASSHLSTGCLPPDVIIPCLTGASAEAAFVYLRTGSINLTGGTLTARRVTTFVPGGFVKIAGGAPPTWLAPTEGPFRGLALWSELSSNKFQINGGAAARLEGTFFTPEATPFTLSGGGDWGQQSAQFITNQLVVSGGGRLSLAPADTGVALPNLDIRLIR